MPDFLLDIRQPLPDEAHEALRAGLVAAIDDLAGQVQRINDAWLMLSVNVDFAQAVKLTVASGQSAIAQMQAVAASLVPQVQALNVRADASEIRDRTAQDGIDALQTAVADLTARVDALEAPAEPAPAEPEQPPAEDPAAEDPPPADPAEPTP